MIDTTHLLEPVIRGDSITAVKIDGVAYPLREPVSLSDMKRLLDVTNDFISFYDIGKLDAQTEWTVNDIKEFMSSSTRVQRFFFSIITISDDPVPRDAIYKKFGESGFDMNSRRLGNTIIGINRRVDNMKKPRLVSISNDGYYSLACSTEMRKALLDWFLENPNGYRPAKARAKTPVDDR